MIWILCHSKEIPDITPDKDYQAQGITDGNVIILDDAEQLLPVSFGHIGPEELWSVSKVE